MAISELSPTGFPVASPVIDYDLRNMTSSVAYQKVDQALVYNASAGTLPALTGAGDITFATPAGQVVLSYSEILFAVIYQKQAAVAGVWQIDLDTTACAPGGNDLSVTIERWNNIDAFPIQSNFFASFDPSCTYTDAQRIATIIAQINGTMQRKFGTATANGTTGIFITADVAGDHLTVSGGAGFKPAVKNTEERREFGSGTSLIQTLPTKVQSQVVAATDYRVLEIVYWSYVRDTGNGFTVGQKDNSNSYVRIKQKAWILFDSASTQDTNFNAATAILFPSELRLRKLRSLSPVN